MQYPCHFEEVDSPKNNKTKAKEVKADNHAELKTKVTPNAKASLNSNKLRESNSSSVKPSAPSTKRTNVKPVVQTKNDDDYENEDDFVEDIDDDLEPKPTVLKKTQGKAQNRSQAISPKVGNKISLRHDKLLDSIASGTERSSDERNRINRSMASGDEAMGFNPVSMRAYLKRKIKLNPLAEIEADLFKAKGELARVRKTRAISESAEDEQKRLIILNKENILLRNELKDMNNNLNKFIDLMKDLKNQK